MPYSTVGRAAIGPRHAKPRKHRAARTVAVIAAGAAAAASSLAMVASVHQEGTPWIGGQAQTVMATELTSVNWTQRTCSVAKAGRIGAAVTDSVHLPKSYLKADVAELYADSSSPSSKAAKYVAKDETYLAEDCPS